MLYTDGAIVAGLLYAYLPLLAVRPERVRLGQGPLRGTVVKVSFYGGTSHVALSVPGHGRHVLVATQGPARVETGAEIALGWDGGDAALIAGRDGA